MASIVPSPLHPSEEVAYSLAGDEFKLSSGGSYETDNPELIANAYAHPWLAVEIEQLPGFALEFAPKRIAPKDDVLAAEHGSLAFDVAEITKVEREKMAAWIAPTAIDAGLDQDKSVVEGGIARTLAAEDKAEEKAVLAEEKAAAALKQKGKDNN